MSTTEQDIEQSQEGGKTKAVDYAQLGQGLYTEATAEIDGTKDAFEKAPPVNDDKYIATLHPSKDPKRPFIEQGTFPAKSYTRRDGEIVNVPALDYFNVNFNFRIESFLDPNADNAPLQGRKVQKFFDKRVSTIVKDGTSEVASLLKMLGQPVNGTVPLESLVAELARVILSGQAKLWVSTTWKAGYVKASKTIENGKEKKVPGHFLTTGQKNFPLAPDGVTRIPVIEIDGQEYSARAYVKDFGPLA